MQCKIGARTTWQDVELYEQHKKNLRNIQPKVDNKAPILNVSSYFKPGVMEINTARLTQIEEENFKLLRQINIIYRSKGRTDCFKPESMNNRVSNMESIMKKNKQTFKENVELLTKIVYVKSRIGVESIRKHQKGLMKDLLFRSKYKECFKMRIDSQNNYDPLIVNSEIPKSISSQKSKCFLDVKDVTENKKLGRLTIEVYDYIVPKTAENFLTLCQHGKTQYSYRGTQFFRIVPGLFCLGGDVEYSIGIGGVSAYEECYFDDENYTLSHNAPGTLSMYSLEENKNASQFLITFKPLTTLDGRHVVFGRVISGFNILKLMEDLGLPSGKPKHKIIVFECGKLKGR